MHQISKLLLNRRSALLTSFALFLPRVALSQSAPPEVASAIYGTANKLLYTAISLETLSSASSVGEFLGNELEARRFTANILNETGLASTETGLLSLASTEFSGVNDLVFRPAALVETQKLAIAALAERKLPTVPKGDEIGPAQLAVIPPLEAGQSPDSDFIVMVDIMLQTLGILNTGSSPSVEYIQNDPALLKHVETLIALVSTRNWTEAVVAAERLLAAGIAHAIAGGIGRFVTWGLALRLVPAVGTIYLAAALIVSIKINWHRFSWSNQ